MLEWRAKQSYRELQFSCNGNTVVKIIKAGSSCSGMRKCITFYSIRVIEIGAWCDPLALYYAKEGLAAL